MFGQEKTMLNDVEPRQRQWAPANCLPRACIAIVFIGSLLSLLNICTGGCTIAHEYRFFGLSFAYVGILFSAALAILNHLRRASTVFRGLFSLSVFGASGAELLFLHIQKNQIGQWCPVCVVIALAVFLLSVTTFFGFTEGVCIKFDFVKRTSLTAVAGFLLGIAIALGGVQRPAYATTKVTGISNKETGITWFGKRSAKVEVYFVSDWFCSYCRKAEPTIENIAPNIGKVAKYTFLDKPVHRETYEYIPFHLSLLEADKRKYFQGRRVLMELASRTKNPGVNEVKEAMAKHGIEFRMADFGKIMKVSNEVTEILQRNDVKMTPSVLILNSETREKKILAGVNEIQEPFIMAAIHSLEQ